MSRLARKAEVIKLARVLGVKTEALDFLLGVDAPSLRALRESASARLFDADEARLKRVAAASKLLPVPLIALIAEPIFGAVLCARVAGLIAPERAAELAQKLRVGFLADVTLEIDPRHVREVLKRIPVKRLVEVALELARRGEFVTLARFVDYVSLDTIKAVMAALPDNAALLQIAFFVEDKTRLNDLIGFLPQTRLTDIILLAADESQDLWSEALALMNDVSPAWRKRLGELAASMDESVIGSMARAAQKQNLWSAVLPIVALLGTPQQQRLLGLPLLAQREVLDAIVRTADTDALWDQLIPLVPSLPPAAREQLARLPLLRESGVLERVMNATDASQLWNTLLPLIPLMDEAGQQRAVEAASGLSESALTRALETVQSAEALSPLLTLLMHLPDRLHARLRPLLTRLAPEIVERLAQEAGKLGLRERLEALWR